MKTKENEELAPGVGGVFAAGFRKILWRGTAQEWLMGKWAFSLFFGVKLDVCRVEDPLVTHI